VLPGEGEEQMTRGLDDGRKFSIIKNFWGSADLVERFARAGISLEVTETTTYFQYATGTLTSS
jgi:hypothetical protein